MCLALVGMHYQHALSYLIVIKDNLPNYIMLYYVFLNVKFIILRLQLQNLASMGLWVNACWAEWAELSWRRHESPFLEIRIEFSEKQISTPERGSQEPGCPPRDIIRASRSAWQVELNKVLTSRILSFKLRERRLGLRTYSCYSSLPTASHCLP